MSANYVTKILSSRDFANYRIGQLAKWVKCEYVRWMVHSQKYSLNHKERTYLLTHAIDSMFKVINEFPWNLLAVFLSNHTILTHKSRIKSSQFLVDSLVSFTILQQAPQFKNCMFDINPWPFCCISHFFFGIGVYSLNISKNQRALDIK